MTNAGKLTNSPEESLGQDGLVLPNLALYDGFWQSQMPVARPIQGAFGDRFHAVPPQDSRIVPSDSASLSANNGGRWPTETILLCALFGALYFTQGISEPTEGLVVQPTRWLLKSWGETNEQITSFAAWITLPWLFKPFYGLLADFLPLGRNRRKNYLILTTAVACFGIAAAARDRFISVAVLPAGYLALLAAMGLAAYALVHRPDLLRSEPFHVMNRYIDLYGDNRAPSDKAGLNRAMLVYLEDDGPKRATPPRGHQARGSMRDADQ